MSDSEFFAELWQVLRWMHSEEPFPHARWLLLTSLFLPYLMFSVGLIALVRLIETLKGGQKQP